MKNTTSTGEFFGTGSYFPASDLEALHEELTVVADSDLEAWIVETKHRMDGLHARWLLAIAEYDRRQVAEVEHALSTTGWVRSTLRLTARVASTVVRQARGLLRMPEVAQNAVAGDITPDAVSQLDTARRKHPDDFQSHEGVFAEVATYLDPTDLRKAIGYWEQQIDFPSAVEQAHSQRRRRRFSINQTFDGMWALSGELDPETGALVNHAIEHAARSAYLDSDDPRQPWQIRADALGDICEQSLRNNTATSKGVKPHVTVTIDAETLLRLRNGLGTIDDAEVPPETVDRLVCDSSIVRILTSGDGAPIDVGRATRVIPSGMRRALDARDRGCQWAGCNAPADWCDAHHIEHWVDGGPTELDNLVLLCRTHHTAIHETAGQPSSFIRGRRTPARAP